MEQAIRTCIGTGKKFPKSEMIRFVHTTGGIVIDMKGKSKGRGASLSMSMAAFDQAVKKNAFQRSLKLPLKPTAAELQNLREAFAEAIAEKKFRSGNKAVTIKVTKADLEKLKQS